MSPVHFRSANCLAIAFSRDRMLDECMTQPFFPPQARCPSGGCIIGASPRFAVQLPQAAEFNAHNVSPRVCGASNQKVNCGERTRSNCAVPAQR